VASIDRLRLHWVEGEEWWKRVTGIGIGSGSGIESENAISNGNGNDCGCGMVI
jgi:hypothetical protein